jgi:hypothetical protein
MARMRSSIMLCGTVIEAIIVFLAIPWSRWS